MSACNVLYCDCAYAKVVPADTKAAVLRRLAGSGRAFEAVPDLCEMSAREDPRLAELARTEGLEVVACYPRAVRWLFHAGGADLPQDTPVHNMRTATADEVATALDLPPEEAAAPTPAPTVAEGPPAWTPWFPVIDYARCTNCMQCLSFCLFDVYGVDADGKIEVRNEQKCKTNCPACSRVCPDVAILFPKYGKGPINGDVVKDEDVASESMKVDISALLGGDIYSALRDRSQAAKKRFSTERDESKALLERKRCLKELKESLDIPDEVLMSLPSAGEIEERARRAREKMELRRARSQTVKDQVRPAPSEQEWGI